MKILIPLAAKKIASDANAALSRTTLGDLDKSSIQVVTSALLDNQELEDNLVAILRNVVTNIGRIGKMADKVSAELKTSAEADKLRYDILIALSLTHPINDKCPITHEPRTATEITPFYFSSGHWVDITALNRTYINSDRPPWNLLTNEPLSEKEQNAFKQVLWLKAHGPRYAHQKGMRHIDKPQALKFLFLYFVYMYIGKKLSSKPPCPCDQKDSSLASDIVETLSSFPYRELFFLGMMVCLSLYQYWDGYKTAKEKEKTHSTSPQALILNWHKEQNQGEEHKEEKEETPEPPR